MLHSSKPVVKNTVLCIENLLGSVLLTTFNSNEQKENLSRKIKICFMIYKNLSKKDIIGTNDKF